MLDTWDSQSVGADEVAVDEDGNPLLDEFGEPISLNEPDKIEVIAVLHCHFNTIYSVISEILS